MFCVSFWSKSKAREVAKSTIRHPSWLYCTVTLLPPEVFYKKVFLKNFGISTGNTCIGISPLGLQLYQKENPTQVFSVNITNFLRLATSENDRFLAVSMVHCYKGLTVQGLDCMTVSDFRVRVTGLVFCF